MGLSRITVVVVALSSAVLLAACGDEPSGSGSGGPTVAPTPAPAQAAAVTWADGVCAASNALGDSVRDAGAALQFDPAGSTTSVDQAQAQVKDRAAAIEQSAASLDSALSAVPAGADPQLTAAQQELQTASERARAALGQLGVAASEVADAATAAEVAASLVTLKAALTGAATDLQIYLESLRGTVGSSEQALRDAFGAAPACQDLAAPATTSS